MRTKQSCWLGLKRIVYLLLLKVIIEKGSGGSKTINKKFILRQNANRYSYGGKVSEFPFIKQ